MKRLFISFFVSFQLLGLFLWAYFTLTQFSYAYLGGLISAFSGALYFAGIYTFSKASSNVGKTKLYSALNYLGLVIVLFSLNTTPEPVHYFAAAFAALNLVMWHKYLSWYSVFGPRKVRIEIDKKLPSKGSLFHNNTEIDVTELLKKPAIWLFYRGNWCPFCVAQVKELAAQYQEIEKLGYQINLVSNQSQEHTQTLGNSIGVNANFLVDENATYSENLGLIDRGGLPLGLEVLNYEPDVLYPAIIITDKNGVVRFFDVTDNYRDRPETEVILNELKAFKNL